MNKKLLITFVLLALTITSCQIAGGQTTPSVDVLPTVVAEPGLAVEGKLVPAAFVNLSFNMGGTLTEVLVEEGQTVAAGQVIARLDQQERLASAVAAAELEVVNARLALKALNDNAEVATAAALQKVADSRDAVRQAERYLNNLKAGSRQTDIDSARADVIVLKDRLDEAQKDFNEQERKPEDDLQRAGALSRLADAQRKYDNAARLLNNLQGSPADIDMAIAEANLSLAQARLAMAESDYADVQNGPDPDALEASEAQLTAAESAFVAAQAALADAELVAPISGTVVKLDLKAGEQVLPGQPAAVLADLTDWKVETQDLNEMEMPQVEIGQEAEITPDALPDLTLASKVESISQIYEEKLGDVTYTAVLDLLETDPRLRWGMTVSVRFALQNAP